MSIQRSTSSNYISKTSLNTEITEIPFTRERNNSISRVEGNLLWMETSQNDLENKNDENDNNSDKKPLYFHCNPKKRVLVEVFESLNLKYTSCTNNANILWLSRKDTSPFFLNPKDMKSKVWMINHFKDSDLITRKDLLYETISNFLKFEEKENIFLPKTFIIPKEIEKIKNFFEENENQVLILKPIGKARGLGIEIIENFEKFSEVIKKSEWSQNFVASKYIENPLLIFNKKIDLRIYVLVKQLFPRIIFFFSKKFLIRFCTNDYTKNQKNFKNQNAHLTTVWTSRNLDSRKKKNETSKSEIKKKWFMNDLINHLKSQHISDSKIFKLQEDIQHILTNSLKAFSKRVNEQNNENKNKNNENENKNNENENKNNENENKNNEDENENEENQNKNPNNFFEIFGYDILIDENLKPFLVEINASPNLDPISEEDFLKKKEIFFGLMKSLLDPNYEEEDVIKVII